MKKNYLFLILMLFAFISAKSQVTREHSVFATVGVSKCYDSYSSFDTYAKRSPFISTQIGYLFDKHFNSKIAFRTGIFLNNQRVFHKSYYRYSYYNMYNKLTEKIRLDIYANEVVSNTSLATPLHVLLKHKNFYFNAGITVNWNIYSLRLGRNHFPGNKDSYTIRDTSDSGNPYWEVASFFKRIKQFNLNILEFDFSADAGIGYYFNIKSQKFSVFANYQFYFCKIIPYESELTKVFNFGKKKLWEEKIYFPMNLSFGLAWHFKTK